MSTSDSRAISLMSMSKNSDVFVAVGTIGILMVMILPLPTPLLDGLLSINITLSVLILLITMYTLKPLDFSIFPAVLLLTTLFRLSLNVASTRVILLHGNEGTQAAGEVIKSFGHFVVGGNYVVGMVVFLILVIINFVVITKGAGRIAEVAARFTLDAMPGKQMAIDADLNAGLVDEREARKRRERISQEADFYGAMDGASKFVRGDAIAGIIITFVNILGGFVIGILQKDMSVVQSAQTYTILSVGDGLVTQIPALIISTAAGILVSRAPSDANLGSDFVRQFSLNPRALGIAASILLMFALIPGLPHLPFMVIGSITAAVAFFLYRQSRLQTKEAILAEQLAAAQPGPEQVEPLLTVDLIELEVGYGLIPLVDKEHGGDLLERIKSIRRQCALETGIVVPPLHIRDNLQLKPGQYSILIKGTEVAQGELMTDHLLAMDPGTAQGSLDGIPTKEPAFGLPALWIQEKEKDRAQIIGYTVVDLSTVIATHLTEIIKKYSPELLGRQETQNLLDNLAKTHPKLMDELIPNLLSLGGVQKVLQNLLKETIPIRDLVTILEVLADYAPITKDPEVLTEYVRQGLARTITKQYQTAEGFITLMTLDQRLEKIISEGIQRTEQGAYLAIEPGLAQKIINQLNQSVERFIPLSTQPIILATPLIRSQLKKLVERFIPNLVVLSHNEISPQVKIKSLGMVSL